MLAVEETCGIRNAACCAKRIKVKAGHTTLTSYTDRNKRSSMYDLLHIGYFPPI